MIVDLNVDIGELPGAEAARLDAQLLEHVTSANVACGGHAGDDETMRRTCAAAARGGVAVGAHVGYLDREHFGRRPLDVAPDQLAAEVREQLGRLSEVAHGEGVVVRYVKPHGALYHRVQHDRVAAAAVARACARDGSIAALVCAPDSALLAAAAAERLVAVPEGFADRGYATPRDLVDRAAPAALLDAEAAAEQASGIATRGAVHLVDGTVADLAVRSLCVHGDGPDALRTARTVVERLRREGVVLRCFA